jgi:sugar phosphate isomerase/epimerase
LLPAHGELVARLAPLVRHFIIHPAIKNPGAQVSLLAEWTKQYGASFLAENTNPGRFEILLTHLESDSGLCMDTGHLLLNGQTPADFYKSHRERVREIHLHGIDREQAAVDGRLTDHRRLRGNEHWLTDLLPLLEDYLGIINLEVFSWEEASASIEVLRGSMSR